jgi:uncharacterized protein (TIGR01244 family)
VPNARRTLAAALVLALGAALAAAAGIEEIDAYYRVSQDVATGGQPTEAQIAALGEAGFHTLLSLRDPSEYDEAAELDAAMRAGMRFASVPVTKPMPVVAAVEEFLKVTDDPGIYPVYIHCSSGNRVGALWMIRRVLRDGWSEEAAEKEADRIGLTSESTRAFALDYIRDHTVKAAAGATDLSVAAGGRS